MDRDDLVALVPDFIRISLQQANRVLNILDMEREQITLLTDTLVDFPLPAGYQEMRNIYIDTIPNRKLTYVTPQQMSLQDPGNSDSAYPTTYTIVNSKIRLGRIGPVGNTDNLVVQSVDGYVMFPNDNATNWLNDNNYDVLLYGALLAAEGWLQTDERLATWKTQYETAIEQLNDRAEKGRFSGDALRVRAV